MRPAREFANRNRVIAGPSISISSESAPERLSMKIRTIITIDEIQNA